MNEQNSSAPSLTLILGNTWFTTEHDKTVNRLYEYLKTQKDIPVEFTFLSIVSFISGKYKNFVTDYVKTALSWKESYLPSNFAKWETAFKILGYTHSECVYLLSGLYMIYKAGTVSEIIFTPWTYKYTSVFAAPFKAVSDKVNILFYASLAVMAVIMLSKGGVFSARRAA